MAAACPSVYNNIVHTHALRIQKFDRLLRRVTTVCVYYTQIVVTNLTMIFHRFNRFADINTVVVFPGRLPSACNKLLLLLLLLPLLFLLLTITTTTAVATVLVNPVLKYVVARREASSLRRRKNIKVYIIIMPVLFVATWLSIDFFLLIVA